MASVKASLGSKDEMDINETLANTRSGAAHYYRTLPEQWPARLQSLRAMGLNTVETYLAWNFHEPKEGDWKRLDQIPRYLDAVADAGMEAIVRPGPYVCAEWDNGGLPMWVTRDSGRLVRSSAPVFMDPVRRYLDKVVPLFADHPTLKMVQVENEYGSWGDEAEYLELIAEELRSRGVIVPLVTSDGARLQMIQNGSVKGATPTVNFGSRGPESFAMLEEAAPGTQPFCMEFWNGWFDHWGKDHVTRSAESATEELQKLVDAGGSANLYMGHGGTNFGTFAGANHEWRGVYHYSPTVTSYDYDAPLSERGEPTPKFYAFKEIFEGLTPGEELPEPAQLPELLEAQTIVLEQSSAAHFSDRGTHPVPPSLDDLDVVHGLVRYTAHVDGPRDSGPLVLRDVRDWARVNVNGQPTWIIDHCKEAYLGEIDGPTDLSVLVESMGRVNYGPHIGDWKGLGGVYQDYARVNTWKVESLELPGDVSADWEDDARQWVTLAETPESHPHPLDEEASRTYDREFVTHAPVGTLPEPRYFRGAFNLEAKGDGYVSVPGGVKGYIWVNGFCLGRYWDRGPQVTLYLPEPVTEEGQNEVVILELVGLTDPVVELGSVPILSKEEI